MLVKIKILPTDRLFSKYIKHRDGLRCQRCRLQLPENKLDCSHYFGRWKWATRFDPRNCITLCRACHQYWGHGAGHREYEARMIEMLGVEGLKDLELRSNGTFRLPEQAVLIYVRDLMRQLERPALIHPYDIP